MKIFTIKIGTECYIVNQGVIRRAKVLIPPSGRSKRAKIQWSNSRGGRTRTVRLALSLEQWIAGDMNATALLRDSVCVLNMLHFLDTEPSKAALAGALNRALAATMEGGE